MQEFASLEYLRRVVCGNALNSRQANSILKEIDAVEEDFKRQLWELEQTIIAKNDDQCDKLLRIDKLESLVRDMSVCCQTRNCQECPHYEECDDEHVLIDERMQELGL